MMFRVKGAFGGGSGVEGRVGFGGRDWRSGRVGGVGWWKKVVEPNHSLHCQLVKTLSKFPSRKVKEKKGGEERKNKPKPILDPDPKLRSCIYPRLVPLPTPLGLRLIQSPYSRLNRLQAPPKRTRVDAPRLGRYIFADYMRGEFVRLPHAVRGEGWVGGIPCGILELGAVFAGFGVEGPVSAVLEASLVCNPHGTDSRA